MDRFLQIIDQLITSRVAAAVAEAWRGMVNLLVPNPCALCAWADAQDQHLCSVCRKLLKEQTGTVFQAQDFADALPLDLVTGQALPVFAASLYTPEMAKTLLNYKDHQRVKVAGFLRPVMYRTMAVALQQLGYAYYRLVPMPSSGAGFRKRGHNPVVTMLPRQPPAEGRYDTGLLKTRWQFIGRTAHHGTGVQQRREQSRKKFRLAVKHRPPTEPVVLIDDVLTTGATIAAAAQTLQMAGFDVVAAVVCSAVMPRS